MSFFDNIMGDMDNLEKEYLGPDYPYHKKISSPGHLGMSSHGSLGALASDIAGIVDYVELLISGSGRASKTGNPLGDRFFIKTGGQCKDYKTNKLVTRSMYIDNVPTANLPIISNMSGISFPEFRGMVPGILEDMYDINPVKMFRAFMEGNEPVCAEVKLPVIDENDKKSTEAGYIPIVELQDLISSGKISSDVVTKRMKNAMNEKETFLNMCDIMNGKENPFKKSKKIIKKLDSTSNIYMLSLGIVLLYILYRVMKK